MEPYLSEQEQIEAIKNWWRRYGVSVLVAIALAAASYGGWQLWQNRQAQSRADAAALFQSMEQAFLLAQKSPQEQKEQQIATFRHLGEQLKSDYPTHGYARFAAWLLARQAIESADYQAAEKEYEWVLAHLDNGWLKGEDSNFGAISRLRLARLKLAQQQHDEALELLNLVTGSAFQPQQSEIKGDVLMAKGDLAGAVDAYEQALTATAMDDPLRQLTEMKLDDVKARLPQPKPEQKP